MEVRDEWRVSGKQFTQLDWEMVAGWVTTTIRDEAEQDSVWLSIARSWLAELSAEMGNGYRLNESEHFILVSVAADEKAIELLQFLERSFVSIRSALPCLVQDDPVGKCPVIVFAEPGGFYDYLEDYCDSEELEIAAVGGVYLNRGWGHFALPSTDLRGYEDVFAHELCHALVSNLRLPLWLDEAIAVTVEDSITHRQPYVLDREIVQQHQSYWTEARMQGVLAR